MNVVSARLKVSVGNYDYAFAGIVRMVKGIRNAGSDSACGSKPELNQGDYYLLLQSLQITESIKCNLRQ